MRNFQLATIVIGSALIAGSGASAQTAATTTKTTMVRHYDCTKPGNANKAACKTTTATPARPAPSPATVPVPAPAAVHRTVATRTVQHNTTTQTTGVIPATTSARPAGATAICNDGTYSHLTHHSGSCSRHKGVKQFY